ncbi:MAG: hypothetical protein JOZ07_08560 [Solirubrobacterales bacterium]|nr:hypothetical protein [Solirubrobacterales bacterium]
MSNWRPRLDEQLGIAALRLALVPVALITCSGKGSLNSQLYPWLIATFGLYSVGSLIVAAFGDPTPRISLTPAVVDLCAVAALVYVTGGAHSPLKFAFYVLPIAAALRLSPSLTASWAVLSVLAFLAVTLPDPRTVLPDDLDLVLDDSLSLLWVSSAAIMLSAMVGSRQRALVGFAEMRRDLVQQALDAGAHEQRRLAEELHDHAVQNVLLARQELADIVRGVPGAADRARAALDETDRQLRQEIFAMHPLSLEQAGLSAILSSLAEGAGHRGGFSTRVRVTPAAERGGQRDIIVTSARELLTNVAKHAHASHVEVQLRTADGMLELTVSDDGAGMDRDEVAEAVRGGHIGLASVRERLRSRDGRLDISARPGAGTTATVTIPRDGRPSR